MQLLWTDESWNDYCYWQTQDKKSLKKLEHVHINAFAVISASDIVCFFGQIPEEYIPSKQACLP